MNIQIVHNHFGLTERQMNYITEKIDHIQKYERRVSDEASHVRVDVERNSLKTSNENVTLQITLRIPNAVIRAEVTGVTVEEATDKAIEKLRKQIERYKTRKHRRNDSGEWIPESTLENITSVSQEEYAGETLKVTKRKKFVHLKPMHEDEAVEQMELLGHDFFAFLNADTNLFSVLYKRQQGEGYGLIELDTMTV